MVKIQNEETPNISIQKIKGFLCVALSVYLFTWFVSVFSFNDFMNNSELTLPKPWIILYLHKLLLVIPGKIMLLDFCNIYNLRKSPVFLESKMTIPRGTNFHLCFELIQKPQLPLSLWLRG